MSDPGMKWGASYSEKVVFAWEYANLMKILCSDRKNNEGNRERLYMLENITVKRKPIGDKDGNNATLFNQSKARTFQNWFSPIATVPFQMIHKVVELKATSSLMG